MHVPSIGFLVDVGCYILDSVQPVQDLDPDSVLVGVGTGENGLSVSREKVSRYLHVHNDSYTIVYQVKIAFTLSDPV